MKKQEKSVLIDKLTKTFESAKSITLVDFTGMNMQAQNELKNKLKESSSKFVVYKNTLIRIAAENAKLPKEITNKGILSGQTAVILGNEDPVAPIQLTGKSEAIKFKAGIIEGIYQDKESLIAISKLPSRDVLVGQTVGAIAGPMYGLINNLEGKIQELFYILGSR